MVKKFWRKWIAATVCMSMFVSGCGTEMETTGRVTSNEVQEEVAQAESQQEGSQGDVIQQEGTQQERSRGGEDEHAVVMVYMVGSNLE